MVKEKKRVEQPKKQRENAEKEGEEEKWIRGAVEL